TFLAFGLGTGSTLAARVHPASSHVSLMGQYVPNVDSPGSDRVRRIIALPHRIYGVFDGDYTLTGAPGSESVKTYFGGHLRLWGRDFTDAPCDGVALRASSEKSPWIRRLSGFSVHAAPPSFIVCELRPIAPEARERAVGEFKTFAASLGR